MTRKTDGWREQGVNDDDGDWIAGTILVITIRTRALTGTGMSTFTRKHWTRINGTSTGT